MTAPQAPIHLTTAVTQANYDEERYLAANPDVARAVQSGSMRSGRAHFEAFGAREGRSFRSALPPAAKRAKLEAMFPLLRSDLTMRSLPEYYDFLTDALRGQFNIIDTDQVSANEYDPNVLALIERHRNGWVLDCGAGLRSTYYPNVINFEIAPYDTTDVRGVAECLPFIDAAFDAVISIAVLEHVKDPWAAAREIARVLKPGGDIYCCVPFLQPLHGYPHHYYNMTHQGLANLFVDDIDIDVVDVLPSTLPIWALTWIVRSWADGLQGDARREFLNLKLRDLTGNVADHLGRAFVQELSHQKNLELACATVLSGRRKRKLA